MVLLFVNEWSTTDTWYTEVDSVELTEEEVRFNSLVREGA